MFEALPFLKTWPYLSWAAIIATSFYLVVKFATSHLNSLQTKRLQEWLEGRYQDNWIEHFCIIFDNVFGHNRLGIRCFLVSSFFSLLSVLATYILFEYVFDILTLRAPFGLEIWEVVAIGAAINIIPDYLSLLETRWLLERFRNVRSLVLQVGWLFIDILLTGLIIGVFITIYLFVTDQPNVTIIELLAIFSVYSIFFFSTFLTSVWAWIFCLSTWFVRFFNRLGLPKVLDVQEKPGNQIALIGGTICFVCTLLFVPMLIMGNDGITPLDKKLCSFFPGQACSSVARLTSDKKEKLTLMIEACDAGDDRGCSINFWSKLADGNKVEAAKDVSLGCETGHLEACSILAFLHTRNDLGVPKDLRKAISLYERLCEAGYGYDCNQLAKLHYEGRGTPVNYSEALKFSKIACDIGEISGCASMGNMYIDGLGAPKNVPKGIELTKQACQQGSGLACANLGTVYHNGQEVDQDFQIAVELYKRSCDSGDTKGCTGMGVLLQDGLGVQKDTKSAIKYFENACENGGGQSCGILGSMYEHGQQFEKSIPTAISMYRSACRYEIKFGCDEVARLEKISQRR